MIKKIINFLTKPSKTDIDIDYLISRGWRKDPLGWFQSYDPHLPEGHPFRYKRRSSHKDNITMEEALYYAKMSDMSIQEVLISPKSMGIKNEKLERS